MTYKLENEFYYNGKLWHLYSEWGLVTEGFRGDRHAPGYDPEFEALELRLEDEKGNEVTDPALLAMVREEAEKELADRWWGGAE